ncbi:MAG: methylated-DNA--[protein]-cysteine S-methyltransferase [Actinobacteria bacterium]|nr:methylated-DNA--[protein]-cysteine S-methyltransferase [Actinomycetota bacterium]
MSMPKLFRISAATSMGGFEIVASSAGLRRVCWPGEKQSADLKSLPVSKAPARIVKLLKATAKQLTDYLAGKRVRFNGKLDLSCQSPFAQKVLRELAKVRNGETITYGELAKRAGSAKAARAVGSILANNPLPIIIPCHRVLSSGGSLGGYSGLGGLELKRRLLRLEANPCDK